MSRGDGRRPQNNTTAGLRSRTKPGGLFSSTGSPVLPRAEVLRPLFPTGAHSS
jgi:hypothetical protein